MIKGLFGNRYLRDRSEEVLNALIHSFGLGLACAATVALYFFGVSHGLDYTITGVVYGVTHSAVYAASVAYHYAEYPPIKTRLRVFDQLSIYAAIAGAYTPVLAHAVDMPWNILLLCILWASCIAGIIYKVKNANQPEKGSLLTYLTFGSLWALIVLLYDSSKIVESRPFFTMSGLCFLIGLVFYVWHYKRFFHTYWHVCVLVGSIVHFYTVWTYIIQ
jgi:hemolysin III